ncbi:hypothetical protein AQUSIP_08010 [Aquicella siphonis]|uniref:Uncharacterized protein n=1 Tax=Aquicella siphonis TaxID=254247 RepID=A0A5E4PGR8_9COXI|nr:hypothetical protein [Aquicella siphonis]VVC75511.1 hypothetical protein AQUSIP_08010 [Aquicella siphonis]
MNKNLKQLLAAAAICALGAFLLTSCYTVKGAFQGAGKDVAVLMGPDEGSHKASSSHTTTRQGAKSKATGTQGVTTTAKVKTQSSTTQPVTQQATPAVKPVSQPAVSY